VARFDGGTITSDRDALLLGQTDQWLDLPPQIGTLFLDGRKQDVVKHAIEEMTAQRFSRLTLGYEDINESRRTPEESTVRRVGWTGGVEEQLAGKSTLNRMELGTGQQDLYKK
jgi:hypothetical protein